MQTQLIEVVTDEGATLRGLFSIPNTTPQDKIKGVVVCCPGFGRACTEIKFRCITEEMIRKGFGVLRFDFQGIGISGGDYSAMTVTRCAYDLKSMILALPFDVPSVYFFAHSLGACVVLRFLEMNTGTCLGKIVFMNPALNQEKLLRLWFAKARSKESVGRGMVMSDEEDLFLKYCEEEKVIQNFTMKNFYHLENQEKDYSSLLERHGARSMIICGANDNIVPLQDPFERVQFPSFCSYRVVRGDHDLEKPDMVKEWLVSAVDFFCKR